MLFCGNVIETKTIQSTFWLFDSTKQKEITNMTNSSDNPDKPEIGQPWEAEKLKSNEGPPSLAAEVQPEQPHDVGNKQSYEVGNKKPPLKGRFKKGKSGNPSGKPKKIESFGEILLDEFNKPMNVLKNGKVTKVTPLRMLARHIARDAATGKMTKLSVFLNQIGKAEAESTAKADMQRRLPEEGDITAFKWTEEQEELFRKVEEADAKIPGLDGNPVEPESEDEGDSSWWNTPLHFYMILG
jgi:Family of unknown function (DUF5681)